MFEFLKREGDTLTATRQIDDTNELRVYVTMKKLSGNKEPYFSVTADLLERGRLEACGCLHDEVAQVFPELEPFLKWHLCGPSGPVHYIENTVYHARTIPKEQNKWFFCIEGKCIRIVDAEERKRLVKIYGTNAEFKPYDNPLAKEPDLDDARRCALWPDATEAQLLDRDALKNRLPALLKDFRADMIKLGFDWSADVENKMEAAQ